MEAQELLDELTQKELANEEEPDWNKITTQVDADIEREVKELRL